MPKYKLSRIGAVPVAEGVRIRAEDSVAFAVRSRDKDISVRQRRERHPVRRLLGRVPFLRGIVRFFTNVYDFADGVIESEEFDPQDIVKGGRKFKRFFTALGVNPGHVVSLTTGLMILLYLAVFVVLLPLGAQILTLALNAPGVLARYTGCMLRIAGTVFAVWRINRLKVMNRLCMYRGAISKTLAAYEESGIKDLDYTQCVLTPRNCRKCEEGFALMVILLSMLVLSFLNTYMFWQQIVVRIAVLLLSASLLGELMLLLEDRPEEDPLYLLMTPFQALEKLFILEPHPQMIEVSICALEFALKNVKKK